MYRKANVWAWLSLAIVLIASTRAPLASATVKLVQHGSGNPYILIKGEIVQGDYKDFMDAARKAFYDDRSGGLFISVSSPGGDVLEAMKIGKAIRKLRLSVLPLFLVTADPSKSDRCYSACIFVWVGSVERTGIGGYIGIHRPHFKAQYFSGLSSEEAKTQYHKLTLITKNYLQAMGASAELVERMYQIRSNDLKVLTLSELENYGLRGTIPAYDEWLTSKCSALTAQEANDYWILQLGPPSHLKRRYREYLQNLPRGYKAYLQKKGTDVQRCRDGAKWDDRQRAAKEVFGKSK